MPQQNEHRDTVRIGIDVGGTFTDFIVVPGGSRPLDLGAARAYKVQSTPHDPSLAVKHGLEHLLATGVDPARVSAITHGTTIGLNAILQRKGARVALLTSTGHKDVLQIGRSRLPRSFDLHADSPTPLLPRDRIVEIDLRFTSSGEPVRPLTEEAIIEAERQLAALAPDVIAVSLIGGYAAAESERRLADRIQADLGLPVTSAAAVWPESREYERVTLAILDAQITPLMTAYFRALDDRVTELGFTAPLFISASNGGSVSLAAAIERPIQTVLSGPAAGVSAAAMLWPGLDMVTVDMGGTSSDIGVLVHGDPVLTAASSIGEHPLIMPVVEVSAIGAGGGSVVAADLRGPEAVLRVGPASVGALPGPAAYGQGGEVPALTDAYLAAGILNGDNFLGGDLPLSRDLALAALDRVAVDMVAGSSHPASTDSVLDGTFRVATAGMAARLRAVLAQHGEIPDRFTFVAFGGAGATHAAMLAEEVGIARIIVPSAAATFCALGAAIAPVRRDFAKTVRGVLGPEILARLSDEVTVIVGDARAWLRDQTGGEAGRLLINVDLRYAGQPTALSVQIADQDASASPLVRSLDEGLILRSFTLAHEHHYGFADPNALVQLDTVRVTVIGPVRSRSTATPRADAEERALFQPQGTRSIRFQGAWTDSQVVTIHPSSGGLHELWGPAVIEKTDTTVLVPDGWRAHIDGDGHLHLHNLTRADTIHPDGRTAEEDTDALTH